MKNKTPERPRNAKYKKYQRLTDTLRKADGYAHYWFEFMSEAKALESLTEYIKAEMKKRYKP